MGVYDFVKGPCPSCDKEIGEDSGDIQIKWFSTLEDCFRTFRPGNEFPEPIEDGLYGCGTWGYCCEDRREIFVEVHNNKFVQFRRGEETEEEAAKDYLERLGLKAI